MPLKNGRTDRVIAANVKALQQDGFHPSEAKAIAESHANQSANRPAPRPDKAR